MNGSLVENKVHHGRWSHRLNRVPPEKPQSDGAVGQQQSYGDSVTVAALLAAFGSNWSAWLIDAVLVSVLGETTIA
jgi:hypothetical protein